MGTLSGLLFFFLSVHSVNTLKCYVCSSTVSNEHCNHNSEDCQAPLDTCMTTVSISGDKKAIVKQCSVSRLCTIAASSVSPDVKGDGTAVTCCSSRLCNYSAASTIQLCAWLLTLPVCLLIILVKQAD
ncbi:prostate stem cell antigen-like [Colossoma macropomum]|uniref:prostate stem cell antigen-like n=1 Tax=Colossoma macropomum TaxID=42526 RepID=UPI001864700C|nr:prostate stem cell antigen-like [Colossoma macropomum]XP_036441135.1 prostate stem cell antigen-like [Colossoma macropomum]